MEYKKLLFIKLISLACLLWLIQQFPAYADPGVPAELEINSAIPHDSPKDEKTNSQKTLRGEFKDSGLGGTGGGSSGLSHLKRSDKTLEGKANLSVSQENKMPPVAPPINRHEQIPRQFVIRQGLDKDFVPGVNRNTYQGGLLPLYGRNPNSFNNGEGMPPLNGRVEGRGFGGPGPMPPFRGQGRDPRFQVPNTPPPLNGQIQDSRFGRPQKRPFFLGAKKDTTKEERPSWLPAHAYSNANMVAPYHNSSLMWWDKSAMPDKPQWVVLSTSVTKYWRGRASNPCWIMVSPNPLAPGNFTFRSRARFGPRGWLQALSKTSKFGFPLYRYWLDQP